MPDRQKEDTNDNIISMHIRHDHNYYSVGSGYYYPGANWYSICRADIHRMVSWRTPCKKEGKEGGVNDNSVGYSLGCTYDLPNR